MKMKWIIALIAAVIVVAGLIFGYVGMSKEKEREREREKPVTAKSRVTVDSNGEAIVTLDREMQKRMGLKTEAVKASRMTPELKGYGRVIDPAPLAALSLDLTSAQATYVASDKEFERLKLLNAQKTASDRALQAAEASAQRDRISVE